MIGGVPAGGNGRRFFSEGFFFLESCLLGIPGNFSQENGIPEDQRGVLGVNKGESSRQDEDRRDESEEVEEEEKEGVRRENSRIMGENGVSTVSSFGRIRAWRFNGVVFEDMVVVGGRRRVGESVFVSLCFSFVVCLCCILFVFLGSYLVYKGLWFFSCLSTLVSDGKRI